MSHNFLLKGRDLYDVNVHVPGVVIVQNAGKELNEWRCNHFTVETLQETLVTLQMVNWLFYTSS